MKITDEQGFKRPITGDMIDPTFATRIAMIAATLLGAAMPASGQMLDDPEQRPEVVSAVVKLAIDIHDEACDQVAERSEAKMQVNDAERAREAVTAAKGGAA